MGKKSMYTKIMRQEDVVVGPEARPDDIVIPVMGPTGAGKSSFIHNILTGVGQTDNLPITSNAFAACTSTLNHYFLTIPATAPHFAGRRVVMVDTPGFDDSTVSDSEILRRIAVWLASSYEKDMRVGGIVYLYPIYPNRMTRNDQSNLQVFKRICGDDAQRKIMLGSTNWSLCPPTIAQQRFEELKTKYWKAMMDQGTQVAQLDNYSQSAWALLNQVLARFSEYERRQVGALKMQADVVDKNKRVPKTEAGKELKAKLVQLLKEHKEAGAQVGGGELRQKKINQLEADLGNMKVPFTTQLRDRFGL